MRKAIVLILMAFGNLILMGPGNVLNLLLRG